MRKYLKVWLLLTSNSFRVFFISRIGGILFLLGKILRFIFFLAFLVLLLSKTKVLSGYNLWQVLLFYLTFNLVDAATQMLFREVYRFRQYIVSGNFDLLLVRPINVLFRALFGGADLLDFITLVPFMIMIGFVMSKIPGITFLGVVFYIILVTNGLLIAAAFHIFVLGLAILTTEIDHAIMIYRDFTSMGKIPIDIYGEPLRFFITFVMPVGVMMSFPVYSLVNGPQYIVLFGAIAISFTLLVLSILTWKYALRRYTSASS